MQDLDRLVVFVTKRLGRRSASMKLLVAALTTRMLSSALGVLSSGSDEEPAEGATAEEVKAVASSGRVVVSATLLLDGATTEDLTAYLSTDPKPALDLLKAALPAAVGLSDALVGEIEEVAAATERLSLCVAVVQVLLPAAQIAKDAGGDELRKGVRELLPMLVAASNANLVDAETRATALSASMAVATMSGGGEGKEAGAAAATGGGGGRWACGIA